MKISVVIPAHNEQDCIEETILKISEVLEREEIENEIIIVDDNSTDFTPKILSKLSKKMVNVRLIRNSPPNGFGLAIRKGLEYITGDAVVIVMADASDDPEDIVRYYRKLEGGYDCVFGSRFLKGSKIENYPLPKLLLNRLANLFIKGLFGLSNNDITNAFKCYRREVIEGVKPILSHHFNLTVELPLKAIVRGYSYTTIPINWYGRETGVSKFKIKEMGSRYMFIILYVFLEKWLSRGDYVKKN